MQIKEKRKKERKKAFLQTFVFGGILVYLVIVLISQQKMINMTVNENKDIKYKLSEEQKLNEELKDEQSIMNTDEFFEKIAREILGYVKKNEKVYINKN